MMDETQLDKTEVTLYGMSEDYLTGLPFVTSVIYYRWFVDYALTELDRLWIETGIRALGRVRWLKSNNLNLREATLFNTFWEQTKQ